MTERERPEAPAAPVGPWRCEWCEEVFTEEPEPVALYWCGECERAFTRAESMDGRSHRCTCGRYGRKLAEPGCPSCGRGALVEIAEEETLRATGEDEDSC